MAAFDTMLKLLAGERPESQRIVAEVLVRQSTAPPKTKEGTRK